MNRWIKRILSCQYMVDEKERCGPIAPSRQIYGKAFQTAWPTALEFTLIALIGFADTLMVSEVGISAVAAVGITNAPKMVLMAFIYSLCAGVTPIVARRTGQGDISGAVNCLKQSIMICALLSLTLCACALLFSDPIIRFSGADAVYQEEAAAYFQIISIGFVFTALGSTINAAMRAVGKPKISMHANITANMVNVVLNFLLIGGRFGFPALGITGAAIATTAGNAVGFFVSLFSVLSPKSPLRLDLHAWRFDLKTLRPLIRLGSGGLAHQLCMKVGFWFFTKIVAELGASAFATHQICMNVLNLSFCFSDGFDVATAALTGQSLGKKRPDMAIVYEKTAQRITFAISLVQMALMYLLRFQIPALFTKDPQIIALAAQILILMAITTPIQNAQVVFAGCMRGAGDTAFVAFTSFMGYVVVRPGAAWLLCFLLNFGLAGAWITTLLDQALRLILFRRRFKSLKWTKIQV